MSQVIAKPRPNGSVLVEKQRRAMAGNTLETTCIDITEHRVSMRHLSPKADVKIINIDHDLAKAFVLHYLEWERRNRPQSSEKISA